MPSKHPIPPPSDTSSSSEDDYEEIDQDQTTPLKPTSKSLISAPKSSKNLNSASTSVAEDDEDDDDDEEDDEEDDSVDGSDSDVPNHKNPSSSSPALNVKPISSKPMATEPSSKHQKSTESTETTVKRKLETDMKDSKKDKKKKKMSDLVEEDEVEKKSGDDQKKLFQRIWNGDDEIVILKGMISFIKEQGKDPSSQVAAFFDSIKDSLRADVNKLQLHGKIRTLKRKYLNTLKRAKKPGEDPGNLKPHDAKVYKLSKKIWGQVGIKDEDGETKSVGAGTPLVDVKKSKSKTKKISDSGGDGDGDVIAAASSHKPKDPELPDNSHIVALKEENSEKAAEFTFLNRSLVPRDFSMLPIPPPELGNVFVKRGWGLMGSSRAEGFNQRWKNVMIAEIQAYLQRIDLVREQTQAMLEVLKSSNI